MGYWGVVMQEFACELPRKSIPRTRVNKGKKTLRYIGNSSEIHRRLLQCTVGATQGVFTEERRLRY
jgi:hypothetical protein